LGGPQLWIHQNEHGDTFDTDSCETITKYIVDMLEIDLSNRPSASILSKEFDRQLPLLTAVTSSKSFLAITEETDPTRPMMPNDQVVTHSVPIYRNSSDAAESRRDPADFSYFLAGNRRNQTDSCHKHLEVRPKETESETPSLPSRLIGVSLNEAAAKGDIEGVKALLNANHYINAQGLGNALQAASIQGDVGVVQLLLEHGAHVNAQGRGYYYGNALQASRYCGEFNGYG